MYAAIAKAKPGDMVEVLPGKYALGTPGKDAWVGGYDPSPDDNSKKIPGLAKSATVFGVHGAPGKLITICGPRTAIFDGTDKPQWKAAAFRVVSSSYVRVAGFTLQNALKGIDVQNTHGSEFAELYTRNTLQEGIRLRYNSQYNLVHDNHVTETGKLWAGWGEGIYVGTSGRNSVRKGGKPDHTDWNTFSSNTFGPGITAENIDIKEYTSNGKILSNSLDGSDIKGENSAISWVCVKGNNYTVADNDGRGTLKNGQGFRVLQVAPGWGDYNKLYDNRCDSLIGGSFCVYVAPEVKRTVVGCTYNAASTKALVCNCQASTRCGRSAGPPNFVAGYEVPGMDTDDEWRPSWD